MSYLLTSIGHKDFVLEVFLCSPWHVGSSSCVNMYLMSHFGKHMSYTRFLFRSVVLSSIVIFVAVCWHVVMSSCCHRFHGHHSIFPSFRSFLTNLTHKLTYRVISCHLLLGHLIPQDLIDNLLLCIHVHKVDKFKHRFYI